jgi:predicted transcriptional regulator
LINYVMDLELKKEKINGENRPVHYYQLFTPCHSFNRSFRIKYIYTIMLDCNRFQITTIERRIPELKSRLLI